MIESLPSLWQFHNEFTLLLAFTLVARHLIKKQKRNHHAYLSWLCLPLGLLGATLISTLVTVNEDLPINAQLIHQYMHQPVQSLNQVSASNYATWVAALWVAVASAALLRLLYQHIHLRLSLGSITRCQVEGLSSKYAVISIDSDHLSPAVYGFFRPKIYLPLQVQKKLSREQLLLITRHEEQHIRQGHLWLNLMWDVLVCMLWFNPLVYFARQQFRHDQELYCDYLVLHEQDEESSRSYGHALLTTITATHSVSLLCSWNAFNQLEERIMNIKSASQKSSKGLLLLATCAIVSTTSLYAIGGQEGKSESKEIRKEIMIKKGDGETKKKVVKVRKNDKEFIEENGERFVIENGNKREMTDQEVESFESDIEEAKKYSKGHYQEGDEHKMIHVEKDDHHGDHKDMKKRIKIVKNDKVFESQNDELFIIEGDNKRAPTEAERAEFEKEIQDAQEHIREIDIEEELGALKFLDHEFDHQVKMGIEGFDLEQFEAEFERAAAAFEEMELQKWFPEEKLAQHHRALVKAKQKFKIDEAKMRKELQRSHEAMRIAREKIKIDEEKIRQGLELARVEMEKLNHRWEKHRNLSEPH